MRKGLQITLLGLMVASMIGLGLAGCAQPSPTPTPKPTTPTSTPTATPTPSPKATVTPTPTATPTTPATSGQLPKVIGWGTYPSGSVGYVLFAGLGNAITKGTGIQVRIMPSGSLKSFVLPMLRGETQLTGLNHTGLYPAIAGLQDWWEEGPQRFSVVWYGEPAYTSILFRGDSNLYSMEDIKGKKFPDFRKLDPSQQIFNDAMLAYGKMTMADVVPVPCSDVYKSMEYLKDGTTDVAVVSPKSASVYEMAASIHGLRILELPADNKEAWARAQAVAPFVVPWKCTVGVGASETSPKWWPAIPYPVTCLPETDEYLTYRITKSVIEGYDYYKDVNPAAKLWTAKMATDPSLFKPMLIGYHPGSIKAFKEAGLWTPELDKLQQEAMKFNEMRSDLWNKAKDEGLTKNILVGTEQWKTFWTAKWQAFVQEAPWRK